MNLPPPRMLVRQTYDGQDDVNWLWENRNYKKLTPLINSYFYSPTIPPLVSKGLKKMYKKELLKIRRLVVNIKQRRRMNLTTQKVVKNFVINLRTASQTGSIFFMQTVPRF